MLKKIAMGAGALVVGLAVIVALQPADFAVERSTAIQAPPDVIYPHIVNLRAMNEWSPWARMDPRMTIAYDGPAAGVGASSSWEGPDAGKGRQTITAVKPNQEVDIRLDFEAPMAATQRALFVLTPANGATHVRWRMEGTNGFVGKAFALLMDMDGIVGGEFEKGLAALKTLVEGEAAKR